MLQTISTGIYEIEPVFRRLCAIGMWVLLGLFVLRVIGLMLVAFLGVCFLQQMAVWYSGLMSHPTWVSRPMDNRRAALGDLRGRNARKGAYSRGRIGGWEPSWHVSARSTSHRW